MARKRIGLAVDGCVANFVEAFHAESRTLHGKPPEGTPQTEWDFTNLLTRDENDKVWEKIFSTRDWWEGLSPMPGIQALYGAEGVADYYFLTKRFDTAGHSAQFQTAAWLAMNTGLILPSVIICTGDKGPLAKALELDAFVDACPENCENVISHGVPNVYLYDAPYNKKATHLPRVADINEFLGKVL